MADGMVLEIIKPDTSAISVDVFLSPDQPVIEVLSSTAPTVEVVPSGTLTLEFVTGSIKGDKGDKGDTVVITPDVNAFDPGDLTLIFDNKLI